MTRLSTHISQGVSSPPRPCQRRPPRRVAAAWRGQYFIHCPGEGGGVTTSTSTSKRTGHPLALVSRVFFILYFSMGRIKRRAAPTLQLGSTASPRTEALAALAAPAHRPHVRGGGTGATPSGRRRPGGGVPDKDLYSDRAARPGPAAGPALTGPRHCRASPTTRAPGAMTTSPPSSAASSAAARSRSPRPRRRAAGPRGTPGWSRLLTPDLVWAWG